MIRTLRTIHGIKSASGANRLIYYFKKIPVLGKHIKGDIYSNVTLKQVLAVIVVILRIVWGFLLTFAYLGLVVYLPILLTSKEIPPAAQYDLFLHIFVCLSFVVAAVCVYFTAYS